MVHTMAELSHESEAEIDAIESLTLEMMWPGREFYPFTQAHFVEAISEIDEKDYASLERMFDADNVYSAGIELRNIACRYWRKAARAEAESFVQRSRP